MSYKCGPTRYNRVDRDAPKALAMCDRSGFLCRYEDLRRQMEFRGNDLKWTGLMVYKEFLDAPQHQNKIPPFIPNMIPVRDPRPDPTYNT